MSAWLLANALVLLHLAFILFVVAGGLLVARDKRLIWLHLPAAAWGALIEFMGWICPLTPLENHFRKLSGKAGYEGGFIEHYLLPLIYPETLTATVQTVLGILVLAINFLIYSWLWRRGTWKAKS
ncbi:DUF2784 domain-containing protein [Betaproteobacteria bacterium SCN2]|nr:DUF2784 domain-containing protein [Betaproteobacteria bacterium SCN2]